MKSLVVSWVILISCGCSLLHAGSVISMADNVETRGALTLSSNSIHVQALASPTEINLADVLEADFGETPFALNYLVPGPGNQLPAGWKALDIGGVKSAGAMTATDGTFVLSGGGSIVNARDPRSDSLFFIGQPWPGDGEWTARVNEIDAQKSTTVAGLMLRESLDATSAMINLNSTTQESGRLRFRERAGGAASGMPVPTDPPCWLRLTRYGHTVFASFSGDGAAWTVLARQSFDAFENPWIGLCVSSSSNRQAGQATLDHISFTPPPSLAQVFPPGVLLQDGTFLAGYFEQLSFDSSAPETDGRFMRGAKTIAIPRAKIAAVLLLPTRRAQIADMNAHVGTLMKNGDIVDADITSIDKSQVIVSSIVLGIATYDQSEVTGCFLQPVQPPAGNYEIRLKDGSILNAAGLTTDAHGTVVNLTSGLGVAVAADEIAQIRAGGLRAQNLAETDWQAAPSSGLVAPLSWEGTNQEQIIAASIGTTLNFPLADKFRAMGVKIALSPDARPDSSATIRVLADGREIARTPPFHAGEQPRFMEVTLPSPKVVSLEADSVYAGTKVLFIDPVAIRARQP